MQELDRTEALEISDLNYFENKEVSKIQNICTQVKNQIQKVNNY